MFRPKVMFAKLPTDVLGDCDGELIRIDVGKRQDLARTFVHEMMHLMFPFLAHWKVRRLEGVIYRLLTDEDREHLLWQMFSAAKKEEP